MAIIPARSGSKGLKNKNIRELAGIPHIGFLIKAALDADIFDTVMMSTDSEAYAEMAKSFGAEVPFLRNGHTSKDGSTSWDVVKEVMLQYEKRGYKFDLITLLQPT